MDYENDPYRDEDGVPLMDFDEDIQSDCDESQRHLLDDEEGSAYDRSPTPVYNDSKAKTHKWLIKISSSGKDSGSVDFGLDEDDYSNGGKSKERGEKRKSVDKKWKGEKKFKDDQEGDNEHSPSCAPQAEEGEEDDKIKELFKMGKKKKKNEKSAAEIALLVENVMAEHEVVAEEDSELNRQGKPLINKLKNLSLLTDFLSKKQLQQEFLDHGVLTLLKNWLEPLPDGSLPNINIRAAVLQILNDFPIDIDRKKQLKKSGLGKVIMFLSKSDEETTSNRKLAKELVDKWCRPIFNKSTRFEDMEDESAALRRPAAKKVINKAAGMASRADDLDLAGYSKGSKSGQSSSRPEAMSMDFLVRLNPDEGSGRMKMKKKLQQLKAPKRKLLQATKLSVALSNMSS